MKMNLKKTIALTTAAVVIGGSAYAMDPRPFGKPLMGPPPVEQLQDQLDLSAVQMEELRTLFTEQRDKRRAMRKVRRAERERMGQKLAEILTPSQLEDLKAMRGCDRKRGKYYRGHRMERKFW